MYKLWIGSCMVYKQEPTVAKFNHFPFCRPGEWTREQAIGFGYSEAKRQYPDRAVEVRVALIEFSESGLEILED